MECRKFLLALSLATIFFGTLAQRNIPENAIRGDFDGDGKIDYLWTDAKYDDEDYVVGKVKLASDNPALKGLSWDASRGVGLVNLGDLDGSHRDFLGCVPFYDSTWTIYRVYGWKDGKWVEVIPSFGVWMGDEDMHRVWKADTKGYVVTKGHDMGGDIDTMFDPVYNTVKIRW